jgi:hypothetical protein
VSTVSNPSQHNPDPPTSQNQPRQKIKKIFETFKELAIVREISIAMLLKRCLRKEPKKKLDQINHLGSKLTKLPHSLALLQSKNIQKV